MQDLGGRNARICILDCIHSFMYLQSLVETLFFFLITWRMGPFANWPDSNKIRQLYEGNDAQGDEITLASARIDQVMHSRQSSSLNRKNSTRPPLSFPLTQGKPSVQGGFFGETKVRDSCGSVGYVWWACASRLIFHNHILTLVATSETGRYPLVDCRLFSSFQRLDREGPFRRYCQTETTSDGMLWLIHRYLPLSGKDQIIMTNIYSRNVHRSILLRSFGTVMVSLLHIHWYMRPDTWFAAFLSYLTDIADSKLIDSWFFFQPFFARFASIAADVKEGLQLDFTNVWNSHYLIPPTRESTTDTGLAWLKSKRVACKFKVVDLALAFNFLHLSPD